MILPIFLAWSLQDGREMSTDRPDKTESPVTVDAGRVQIEMDLVVASRDEEDDAVTSSRSFARFNLRVGVSDDLEFDLQWESYSAVRVRSGGTLTHEDGAGDLALRAKWSLAGNDGSSPGFAILPFVTLPTHHADTGPRSVAGGLILPLSFSLPGDFSLGAMTELDVLRGQAGKPVDAVFINSLSLGHGIVGELEGYVEFYSEVVARRGNPWVGTLDAGLTFKVAKNVQLDAGVNMGVTKAAVDQEFFAGISWRF